MNKRLLKSSALGFSLSALLVCMPAKAQEPYVGEIRMFGFSFCPQGWLEADGRLLHITDFTTLFALYGNTYGGDGVNNFALPDLRGRVPIGQGNAPGLSPYRQGDKGGEERVYLTTKQMPAHGHGVMGAKAGGDNRETVALGNKEGAAVQTAPVKPSGESLSHENRPPYLVMRYCVAFRGNFPPRK